MNITIVPHPLKGHVSVISSKSLSHRYMIAAGLADGVSHVENVLESDDLEATKNALSHLGVRFEGYQIDGSKRYYDGATIDCFESGSTLRMMIPIFMMQNQPVQFIGRGRLPVRPLDVYEETFQYHPVTFKRLSEHSLPLLVQGPLIGGRFELRGDVSSQFISGLLFALPLAKKDSIITLTTPLASKGYVDLTLDVLKEANIQVVHKSDRFEIKGRQTYQALHTRVEGDFSQAAFWMVAGLFGDMITLSELRSLSKQGDRAILDILEQMNGKISFEKRTSTYVASPSKTKGTTIDLSDIPDLGPILMVLAAASEGVTHFKGCHRLRSKESDRLLAMYHVLTTLGVSMTIEDDDVWIEGQSHFKGHVTCDGAHDHRIVMACAIAAIKAQGPITITDIEAVHKSYPTFFEIYRSLGGQFHESE